MNVVLRIIIFFLLFTSKVEASKVYNGSLVQAQPNPKIQLDTGESYCLITNDPSLKDDVARLLPGDTLKFHGELHSKCLRLIVFEQILISNLLGVWQSHNWLLFTFSEGNKLLIENPLPHTSPNSLYNFALYPGYGDYWSILISNENESRVGLINILQDQLFIKFIDSTQPGTEELLQLHKIQ
ncbi:MAG: hypothetical protein H6625_08325 [Bdellovibrionaceae bacterium]|nr:hypothetical protein [Pseudobdellovibrionaceae bacterium]